MSPCGAIYVSKADVVSGSYPLLLYVFSRLKKATPQPPDTTNRDLEYPEGEDQLSYLISLTTERRFPSKGKRSRHRSGAGPWSWRVALLRHTLQIDRADGDIAELIAFLDSPLSHCTGPLSTVYDVIP